MESLLAKLSSEAEQSTHPEGRAIAHASLGIALAQLGRISEARELVGKLRNDLAVPQSPRAAIKIFILEGLIYYYNDRNRLAIDRIKRAHVLSIAAGLNDLTCEASVWLSHLAFNFNDYDLLRDSLAQALGGLDKIDDSLRARLSLVIADAFQYLGEWERSRDWYYVARLFARHCHDHAVMVAIEYNRLVMGQSRIRVERIVFGFQKSFEKRNWIEELRTVQRLHDGFEANALSELLLISEAQWCEVNNDFAGALVHFQSIRTAQAAEKCGMSEFLLDLQILWCRVLHDKSIKSVRLPELSEINSLSDDDQLIALSLVRDIYDRLNIKYDQATFDATLDDARQDCRKCLLKIGDAIAFSVDFLSTARMLAERR